MIQKNLTEGKCRLLKALDTFRRWDATDPRDKVYGILGLAELDEERQLITVNYNRSVAEVYHDVAIAILKQTGDLSVCAHVYHDPEYDGDVDYKSWAPRWDQWSPFRIEGDAAYQQRNYSWSSDQLTVCGRLIDSVDYVDPLMGEFRKSCSYESVKAQSYPILRYWGQKVSSHPPPREHLSPGMTSSANVNRWRNRPGVEYVRNGEI
jgi:hypothetical protein